MALDDKEEAALRADLKKQEDEVEKWKTHSRKHEDRAKENAAAADELTKLKASQLSDEDRRKQDADATAKQLAEMQSSLDDEKRARVRAEVAAAKGLTPGQAKRLTGTTQEELEADADDILENFKPTETGGNNSSDKGNRPATRPTATVKGGSDPEKNNEVVETDPAKLAESVPRT